MALLNTATNNAKAKCPPGESRRGKKKRRELPEAKKLV
jgi:hypothetical protein